MEFNDFYKNLINEFKTTSNFTLLNQSKDGLFHWPNSSGVYVIWEKLDNKKNNLIYIGMTGKFSKNESGEIKFNNASFKSRINRWTPYRFCESKMDDEMKYNFRFGPKEANTTLQNKIKYDIDAYQVAIPYSKIEIHCFHINESHPDYSPVLFESILLTKYLKAFGNLPPANNSL